MYACGQISCVCVKWMHERAVRKNERCDGVRGAAVRMQPGAERVESRGTAAEGVGDRERILLHSSGEGTPDIVFYGRIAAVHTVGALYPTHFVWILKQLPRVSVL